MDSTLTAAFLEQGMAMVSAHPEAAVTAAVVIILLEQLWPLLPVKGNSTASVVIHALAAAARVLIGKRQPPDKPKE